MKHSGKAAKAAFRLILIALVVLAVILGVGAVALPEGAVKAELAGTSGGLWLLFTLFTLYFFRDPKAHVPTGASLVVAPGHGKVDVIGTA